MASGGDDLSEMFQEFCKVTVAGKAKEEKKNEFTSKACQRLVKECWPDSKFPKASTLTDSSSFAKCKDAKKTFMTVNTKNINRFIEETALAIVRTKKNDMKIPATDENVQVVKKDLKENVKMPKGLKQAKDSDVTSRLTDTKGYTGAHKERFGDDGKGKGKEGRVTTVKNDGYTQSYKNKDTFDKTH